MTCKRQTVKVTSNIRMVRRLKDLVLSFNYPCIENMLSFSFGLVYSRFCKKDWLLLEIQKHTHNKYNGEILVCCK